MTKLRELGTTVGDLWRSSALIQGVLALMFGGTICYLAIQGREAPEVLFALVGTIIGYYFGTKERTKE
ncbi:hypothetical protein ES703_23049 [subsurface metagenome]